MKFNKNRTVMFRWILVVALGACLAYSLSPRDINAETKASQDKAVNSVDNRERWPTYEGLILQVETYIGRHQKANGGIRADVWPVLLVKDGKFVDPDVEVDKIGFEQFIERWLKGRRFAVYGDGGRYGYLKNLSLVEKPDGNGLQSSQATLVARNGGDVNLQGDHIVKGAKAWQFVGRPLAIEMAQDKAGEVMLVPLVNPDPPLTAALIQSFISDVNIKKLADEFERRLLIQGGVAEGATVLERKQPYFIANLDVDGNGLPDVIGDFSLLVERNGKRDRFRALFIRYDSGSAEAIQPISDDKNRVDSVSLVSFLRTNDERKAASLLTVITPAWDSVGSYALLTRKTSGWVMEQQQ